MALQRVQTRLTPVSRALSAGSGQGPSACGSSCHAASVVACTESATKSRRQQTEGCVVVVLVPGAGCGAWTPCARHAVANALPPNTAGGAAQVADIGSEVGNEWPQ